MFVTGEEWVTSSPFLYFANHDDEKMREQVAEGRKSEFAGFGFEGDVPNPEANEIFEKSTNVGMSRTKASMRRHSARVRHSSLGTNPTINLGNNVRIFLRASA
jgi:1,4-alpha-glucan branching enzyme